MSCMQGVTFVVLYSCFYCDLSFPPPLHEPQLPYETEALNCALTQLQAPKMWNFTKNKNSKQGSYLPFEKQSE